MQMLLVTDYAENFVQMLFYLLLVCHDSPWECVVNAEVIFQAMQKPFPGQERFNFHPTFGSIPTAVSKWEDVIIWIHPYNSKQLPSKLCLQVASIQKDDWSASTLETSFASIK